jgi:hypothetical protein
MSGVWVDRTRALKRFKDQAGYANSRLNTIIVGLEGVKRGDAVKPVDLAVSWQPKNVAVAADIARGFATNAVMVYIVDALESYMIELADRDIWINDAATLSTLRGDFQTDRSESILLTNRDCQTLAERLIVSGASPADVETLLRDFTAKHFGRRKRPSMRVRFSTLMALTDNVPAHYDSAVQFLISWRNRHVHGRSTERVSPETRSCLASASSQFYDDHAHLDVDRMIANYDAGNPPTLKEVSSLKAVVHRVVSRVDQSVLRNADAHRAFVASLRVSFRNEQSLEERVKEYWGKDVATRKMKLVAMVSRLGFRNDAAPDDPPLYLADEQVRTLAEMKRDEFTDLVLSYD